VVGLVDDQEFEAIAQLVHVPVGALVGGDGQRREPADAVAVASDRAPVHGADLAKPLIEQHARRHEGESAQPGPFHGGQSDAGLAAPGGQGDDATSLPEFPGRQRSFLVRTEVDLHPRLWDRAQGAANVREVHTTIE